MLRAKRSQKAIALFVVIATVMVVVILAGIILNIMSSQARLTRHQVGRIQAYYAAMAGINLAYEMLRSGNTNFPIPRSNAFYVRDICRDPRDPNPCVIFDPDLPVSVPRVVVTVSNQGRPGCDPPGASGNPVDLFPVCIKSLADYTYTP